MTQEEKYITIINALVEVLAEKDRTISFKDWKIADLEEKLKVAEAALDSRNNKEGEIA